jgi:hypothetical protein
MRPVELSEIKSTGDYELARETLRPAILALKKRRRIHVGNHLTLLFENHETVRYQIQEMIRIERIVRPADIAHEVRTYNELIPAHGELSATLLIAYETPAERDVKLRELLGLEMHLWLEVAGADRTCAVFDAHQIASHRISAVQYIRFKLQKRQMKAFPAGAAIVSDHPAYAARRELTPAELEELAPDFA